MMDLFAPTHLLILLAILLVLFGPNKLGDIGGTLGRSIHDFKRAMNEPENLNSFAPIAGPLDEPPPSLSQRPLVTPAPVAPNTAAPDESAAEQVHAESPAQT
jgi:sec-independent protein translocase protein TatA